MTIEKAVKRVATFNTMGAAIRFRDHAKDTMVIMLGHDDLIFVATGREARILSKAGYQFA